MLKLGRMLIAGLVAVCAGAPSAAPDDTADKIVARIDACIGRQGAPQDHADQCLGLHAQPCMEAPEGQSTRGMVGCLAAETAAWDTVLAREYAALLPKLDSGQRAAMTDAQQRWLDFRRADCAIPYALVEGTLAQPWSADCVMQRTARRALQIRGYIDFLEE